MNTRPRLAVAGLLALVVLSTAACSSSGSASSPGAASAGAGASVPAGGNTGGGNNGGAVDASSILTSDAAASIIGGTVTKVQTPGVGSAPGMSLASYTNGTGDSVTILVEPVPAAVGATILQAAIRAAGANGDLVPVSGLGDTAGQVTGPNEATVAFAKGNTLVVVYAQTSNTAGSDLEPKLQSLAQQIAGKL